MINNTDSFNEADDDNDNTYLLKNACVWYKLLEPIHLYLSSHAVEVHSVEVTVIWAYILALWTTPCETLVKNLGIQLN
jgi:hypothetical protein